MATDCGAILVVDENARFRAFASGLLARAGYRMLEAVSGEEAVASAREDRPGLVLLDVRLPDISGFEVCRRLRDEFGDDLPIIFVSGDRIEPLDRAAGLLVGGDDYLVKPVDPDELLARARRLISRTRGLRSTSSRGSLDASLTERELEVLQLLAEGRGSKEIAQELVISPKTVSSHIQRVLAKLGAHSRAEAVAIAYQEGVARPGAASGDDAVVTAHLSATG